MNQEIHAIRHDVEQLTQHARALFEATADIASEKVVTARDQLDTILNHTRHAGEAFYEGAVDRMRDCRDTIRKHPYETLAVGLVIGAFIGLLSVRRYVSHHLRSYGCMREKSLR
jgi:ElaB/YqjD/DUF883 family membrane-anchored ribosome-binding protein